MDINNTKILVCDDSVLARSQLIDVIKSLGSPEIVEAKDGNEALNLMTEACPNLAFMDICMPNMDGIEVLRKAMSLRKKPYIVIVSSFGTKEKIMEALELGAKDFIQKPFSEERAKEIIKKSLDRIKEN